MKILGNMQLLFSCSRVLICFRYQNGYCGCRGSLDCVEFKKLKKKKRKMKNRVLQQTLFYFCVFTSWTLFWGSIRIGKIVWERCARQKNILTFCRQLRCEILEISSYKGLMLPPIFINTTCTCTPKNAVGLVFPFLTGPVFPIY